MWDTESPSPASPAPPHSEPVHPACSSRKPGTPTCPCGRPTGRPGDSSKERLSQGLGSSVEHLRGSPDPCGCTGGPVWPWSGDGHAVLATGVLPPRPLSLLLCRRGRHHLLGPQLQDTQPCVKRVPRLLAEDTQAQDTWNFGLLPSEFPLVVF